MSDSRQGAASAAFLGPVGRHVARRLASVTRFDASDLRAMGPEEPLRAMLTLHLRQELSFTTSTQEGAGRLPKGVGRVSSSSLKALGPALNAERVRLEEQAPSSLQAWAHAEPQGYRRLLPGVAALGMGSTSLGCEAACHTCSGQARVVCPQCFGVGHTACFSCSSTGKQRCGRCAGNGTAQCLSCGGGGRHWETVHESVWNSGTNAHEQQARQVSRSCFACAGSGRENCASCGGQRYVTCTSCNGSSHVSCAGCFGACNVACQGCGATGLLHAWGTVTGGVQQSEAVIVESDDDALVRLLKERAPPARLPEFGAFLGAAHEVSGSRLTSRYRVAIEAIRAPIEVQSSHGARAGRFTFYGLGSQAEVLDHCNLEGHVLSGDLEAMEAEVGQASWFKPIRATLVERTMAFIESELNLLILSKVAGRNVAAPLVRQQVEQDFAGMVDEPYIERAVRALRLSFARVCWAIVIRPGCALVAGFGLAIGVALAWPAPLAAQSAWLWAAGGLVAAVLGWFALERWAAKRLRQIFGDEAGARVQGELAASNTLMRLRMGAVTGLLAASLAVRAAVPLLIEVWRRSVGG